MTYRLPDEDFIQLVPGDVLAEGDVCHSLSARVPVHRGNVGWKLPVDACCWWRPKYLVLGENELLREGDLCQHESGTVQATCCAGTKVKEAQVSNTSVVAYLRPNPAVRQAQVSAKVAARTVPKAAVDPYVAHREALVAAGRETADSRLSGGGARPRVERRTRPDGRLAYDGYGEDV